MAEQTNPWEDCVRYEFCNVNNCPLHPDYNKLETNKLDIEQKCTVSKPMRLRIGTKYNLPNLGLTPHELKGKANWDSMPEEKKESMRKRAKMLGDLRRGGNNTPSLEIGPKTHSQNDKKPQIQGVEMEVSG